MSIVTRGICHSRGPGLRWLLCLVLPIGSLATVNRLGGFRFEYLALTFVATACCGLCLYMLERPLRQTIAAWTLLSGLLVAYYLEYYEILMVPWVMTLFPVQPFSYEPSRRLYFSCFETITLAFVGFTAAVSLYHAGGGKRSEKSRLAPQAAEPAIPDSRNVAAAVFAGILLAGITSFVVHRYGLIMGLEQQNPLPFHLQGVIVYFRLITIPMLLMYVVFAGLVARRRAWRNGGIVLLIVYALSDMLLRASKGTLPIELLCLLLLWLLSGQRIGYRQLLFGLGALAAAFMLFPFIEVFRSLRASDLDLWSALMRSLEQVLAQGRLQRTVTQTWASVTMRVTGTGALLNVMGRRFRFLGWRWFDVLTAPHGMKGYTTIEVFGATPELANSFAVAPSLLGYFYIVGGNAAVMAGTILFALAIFRAWSWIRRLPLRSPAVSQAMFLFLAFGTLTEGTIDEQIFKVAPLFIASVLLLEVLSAWGAPRRNGLAARAVIAGRAAHARGAPGARGVRAPV